jgi:hypothetical protein
MASEYHGHMSIAVTVLGIGLIGLALVILAVSVIGNHRAKHEAEDYLRWLDEQFRHEDEDA